MTNNKLNVMTFSGMTFEHDGVETVMQYGEALIDAGVDRLTVYNGLIDKCLTAPVIDKSDKRAVRKVKENYRHIWASVTDKRRNLIKRHKKQNEDLAFKEKQAKEWALTHKDELAQNIQLAIKEELRAKEQELLEKYKTSRQWAINEIAKDMTKFDSRKEYATRSLFDTLPKSVTDTLKDSEKEILLKEYSFKQIIDTEFEKVIRYELKEPLYIKGVSIPITHGFKVTRKTEEPKAKKVYSRNRGDNDYKSPVKDSRFKGTSKAISPIEFANLNLPEWIKSTKDEMFLAVSYQNTKGQWIDTKAFKTIPKGVKLSENLFKKFAVEYFEQNDKAVEIRMRTHKNFFYTGIIDGWNDDDTPIIKTECFSIKLG